MCKLSKSVVLNLRFWQRFAEDSVWDLRFWQRFAEDSVWDLRFWQQFAEDSVWDLRFCQRFAEDSVWDLRFWQRFAKDSVWDLRFWQRFAKDSVWDLRFWQRFWLKIQVFQDETPWISSDILKERIFFVFIVWEVQALVPQTQLLNGSFLNLLFVRKFSLKFVRKRQFLFETGEHQRIFCVCNIVCKIWLWEA